MRKCPYCGIVCDIHTIGGEHCLSRRLKHSEAKLSGIDNALREFRFQLSRDPYISDDTRITVIGHLDTALLENEDEDI
jgi:hypothetical protein